VVPGNVHHVSATEGIGNSYGWGVGVRKHPFRGGNIDNI